MPNIFKKSLGELLTDNGYITKAQLDEAIQIQQKSHQKLGKILNRLGYIEEETIYHFLEDQLGVKFETEIHTEPQKEIFELLPLRYCKNKGIAPVYADQKNITVYISEPTNTDMVNQISFMTGLVVDIAFATENAISEFIERAGYIASGKTLPEMNREQNHSAEDKIEDSSEENSPVVKYVEETLRHAVEQNASDIHFERFEQSARLRLRVDGALSTIDEIDIKLYPAVVSRIKILSELDISEKRLPQDGRIMTALEGRQIDVRVSIIPTVHGENAVLRILDKGKRALTLSDIGFPDSLLSEIQKEARRPFGMILVTGPTGSGKTTTLYGVLQYILSLGDSKVLTIEDPVEYQVEGVSQVQVHSDIGLTFAAGLRAFLRHDPDVMMVGEIRDKETAEIAVRAALTGHLVLSTVHTNDASSSLTRFIDMGIPPYLLTSTVNVALAQRLIRRLCPHCKTEHKLTKTEIDTFEIADVFKAGDSVFQSKGCKKCQKTGFSGRLPIFELMTVSENIKKAVLGGASSYDIKDTAEKDGMKTLRDSGLALVKEGMTTLEEIEKIVAMGE